MAVDSVLQFTLVTANGEIVTASATQNPDLFWALRGGGGSTFGILLSVTIKVYPSPKTSGLRMTISATGDAFWNAVGYFHASSPAWTKAGLFGLYTLSSGSFSIEPLLAPYKTVDELKTLAAPFLAQLDAARIRYTASFTEHPNFLASYNALFTDEGAGVSFLTSSRLFLRRHIESDNAAITAAYRNVVDTGRHGVIGHMVGPPNTPLGNETSVNPVWREAVLLPLHNAFITGQESDVQKWQVIRESLDKYDSSMKKASPGSGAYLNEANIFDPAWREDFYGSSYARLLQIKKQVDPTGLFWVKTGVGSEYWQEVNGRLCKV